MKKAIVPLCLLVFLILFAQVFPVYAHPADLYVHSIYVTLAKDRLSIQWELKTRTHAGFVYLVRSGYQ